MNPIILVNSLDRNDKIIIAPFNAQSNFRNHLPRFTGNFRLNTLLPENFSWHLTTPDDSPSIVEKKKNITPVQYQYRCGCCWAMSIATSISDCFVVAGLTEKSPNISTTRIMMCVSGKNNKNSESKCLGANPAVAMKQLVNVDIVGNECIDYSWCESNKDCTSLDSLKPLSELNCFIPSPCSCKTAGLYASYNIVDPSVHYLNEGEMDPTTISKFRATILAALFQTGPLVTIFDMCSNFYTGNFSNLSVNQGVYFDRCDYTKNPMTPLVFSDGVCAFENIFGAHAVTIVGWGLAKNVQYDTNKFGNVPFWWCRNSWGTKWGNDGYFKMAMYPFNKTVCCETLSNGIILYKPKGPPDLKPFPKFEKINTCDTCPNIPSVSIGWKISAIVEGIVIVILIGYIVMTILKRAYKDVEYIRLKQM